MRLDDRMRETDLRTSFFISLKYERMQNKAYLFN
jgi:hypothetical protein